MVSFQSKSLGWSVVPPNRANGYRETMLLIVNVFFLVFFCFKGHYRSKIAMNVLAPTTVEAGCPTL